MKNIHLLPTENRSRISKGLNGLISLNLTNRTFIQNRNEDFINQHIYITSEDSTNTGDWCFEVNNLESNANSPKFVDSDGNTWWLRIANANDVAGCPTTKKIVLTTDPELINAGVEAIGDNLLEWIVMNPDSDFFDVNEFKINPRLKLNSHLMSQIFETNDPILENIFILPTENESRIFMNNKNGSFLLNEQFDNSSPLLEAHHIYIISDEKLKDGDTFLSLYEDESYMEVETLNFEKLGISDFSEYADSDFTDNCKKVILTTDSDLIKIGIQAIDDTFLEWIMGNPDCKYVKIRDIKTIPALQLTGNNHLMYQIIYPNVKINDCVCKQPKFDVLNGICDKCGNSILHLGERIYVDNEIHPEDIWNDEKMGNIKKFIDEHKELKKLALEYLDNTYPSSNSESLYNIGNKTTIGLVNSFIAGAKQFKK